MCVPVFGRVLEVVFGLVFVFVLACAYECACACTCVFAYDCVVCVFEYRSRRDCASTVILSGSRQGMKLWQGGAGNYDENTVEGERREGRTKK